MANPVMKYETSRVEAKKGAKFNIVVDGKTAGTVWLNETEAAKLAEGKIAISFQAA